MNYVKSAYVSGSTPLRFVPVEEGPAISVYGSASTWEVRLGGTVMVIKPSKEEAVAVATEMAEAAGDIVYEVPV